jgi:hypothetical protein
MPKNLIKGRHSLVNDSHLKSDKEIDQALDEMSDSFKKLIPTGNPSMNKADSSSSLQKSSKLKRDASVNESLDDKQTAFYSNHELKNEEVSPTMVLPIHNLQNNCAYPDSHRFEEINHIQSHSHSINKSASADHLRSSPTKHQHFGSSSKKQGHSASNLEPST